MNKERLLKKLPLITFVFELILIIGLLICTLYGYHDLLGDGALNSLRRNSTPDDAISGWLMFPAMVLDFFGAVGYVVIAIGAIIYLVLILIAMGWNMWMVKQNKNNKLWMKIAGILPSALLVFKIIKEIIGQATGNVSILMMFYTIPAIVILIESIVYTCMKSKTLEERLFKG